VTIDAIRRIAAEIRSVLDRHSDIFEDHPNFVREALVARLNIGKSRDVDGYIERLQADLLSRNGLRPIPGIIRRDPAILKILRGHSDTVTHVVALDRDRALSASYDYTLRLWNLATGDTIRVFKGHSGTVDHVVAVDRDRALSASWDYTLRLWDLATGDTVRVLNGHSSRVTHVVALDRDRALSASDDHTLRLWDLATGDTIRVLEANSRVTHLVALDRDRALSASWDHTLRLWELTDGRVVSVIGADDPIVAVAMTLNSHSGIAALSTGRCFLFKFNASSSSSGQEEPSDSGG
jgi:WD40 repeat protein